MTAKKKSAKQELRKLTDFFSDSPGEKIQDGAGRMSMATDCTQEQGRAAARQPPQKRRAAALPGQSEVPAGEEESRTGAQRRLDGPGLLDAGSSPAPRAGARSQLGPQAGGVHPEDRTVPGELQGRGCEAGEEDSGDQVRGLVAGPVHSSPLASTRAEIITDDDTRPQRKGPAEDPGPGADLGHDSTEGEGKRHTSPQAKRDQARVDPFIDIDTSQHTVSPGLLKDMMVALRASLQQDLSDLSAQIDRSVGDLGDRVQQVEDKMAEFKDSHNNLIDAHYSLEKEVKFLKTKLADLEDRSRRNNVKFRGIPESVQPAHLIKYLERLIESAIPNCSPRDLIIDRAHRLPKPRQLADEIPRDVIARLHFFHIKEALMSNMRKRPDLPEPFTEIRLYADLSQATLAARKTLAPITSVLRKQGWPYRWGFPTKLVIHKEGTTHIISSLEEGSNLLKKWGLTPPKGKRGDY